MPSNAIVKTEWVRNRLLILLAFSVFVLGFFVYKQSSEPNQPLSTPANQQAPNEKNIGRIGEGYFSFEVADSSAERTLGLSGREQLPDTEALLFVFESADKHCFWMKDMKFSIDILWFDENKNLVYEKRNVSPETYPESFCPDLLTKYVAEVAAGIAEKNQIKLGDHLDIEL
jgi:uncharacterized membrane protein (UPF0127 family)